MSTYKTITVKCALCAKESTQTKLASVCVLGEPDLDFRPSEMLRSTMRTWLMECPYCGYIAKDIHKKPHTKKEKFLSVYQGADKNLPALALVFEKHALYCASKMDEAGAIRAYLCAAWACDDVEDGIHAKTMRKKCLAFTERYLKHCRGAKWRSTIQLKADLLRRTEDIGTLRKMAAEDRRLDFTTRELLVYQKTLAERRDYNAHSREEIDLYPYDDFFERKRSNKADPSLELEDYLAKAVYIHEDDRSEALAALDIIRPRELNLPYYEYDVILRRHRGIPIDKEHPYNVTELAKIANREFLDMLESFVVSNETVRERVTLQSKVCMAMLHQLYTSPFLAGDLKNYACAQKRLYLMRIDDPFTDDSCLVGLIEPKGI